MPVEATKGVGVRQRAIDVVQTRRAQAGTPRHHLFIFYCKPHNLCTAPKGPELQASDAGSNLLVTCSLPYTVALPRF
jgi:hypothetical protein